MAKRKKAISTGTNTNFANRFLILSIGFDGVFISFTFIPAEYGCAAHTLLVYVCNINMLGSLACRFVVTDFVRLPLPVPST